VLTVYLFSLRVTIRIKSVAGTRGGPLAWGLGEVLTTPHRKIPACYEKLHITSELAGSCEHDNKSSVSIKGREFLD